MATAVKGANKILLAVLGGAILLVIAAIILLAITLGKANNLNTPASTSAPASQPCDQKTIEAFYFSVSSSQLNFNEIGSDTASFIKAVNTLQQQIGDALTQSPTTTAAPAATTVATTAHARLSHEIVFDANSNFLQPVILGISQGANGSGVAVVASTVFTGTTLPSPNDITARLNTNGLKSIQVNNGTQANNVNTNTQFCQRVSTNPPGGGGTNPPTSPPPSPPTSCAPCTCSSYMTPPTTSTATSPPATNASSVSTTTTAGIPTTSNSTPAPTTSTQAITQPTTTTSTTPTSTLPGSVFPCIRDVTILVDCSTGLGNPLNYRIELDFISRTLVVPWTVSPAQVEAAAAVYDIRIGDFNGVGNFKFYNTSDLQTAILNFDDDYFDAPASIKTGLQGATGTQINGYRNGIPRVTLLFTSTSDPTDVNNALPYAAQLKINGNSLIVVGIGPFANMNTLASLASGTNFLFSSSSYDSLQSNTMLASQINTAICVPPPPSTSTTTTTTTTTTTPVPPSYPCMKDILILMDTSLALNTSSNYLAQLNFVSATLISNWTVSPNQVEANPVLYDGVAVDFTELGSFSYQNLNELQTSIISADTYFYQGAPSLKVGLQEATSSGVGGYRPGMPAVTLLFTASSDPVDTNNAMPYADVLKRNGNSLIVIGMGPYVNLTVLTPLASGPNFAFFAPDYSTLASNVALANQINTAICLTPPTTTAGPTTTTTTITMTTAPTTTAPSTTTTPTTTTTTTPTTTTTTTTVMTTTTSMLPTYPCKKDILILMDNSNALYNSSNYRAQLGFISSTLIANWTINLQQVEANPVVYSQNVEDFTEMGSFGYNNLLELQYAIGSALSYYFNDPPSITVGLQESVGSGVAGWRSGVPRVTLLFTASSDANDVNSAMPYAAQLKSSVNSLIVIGLGSSINMTLLTQLASGSNFAFSASDFSSLLNNVALANQIVGAICTTPPPMTTGAPVTTASTTTPAVTTTTAVPPSYPCMRDVTLMIDVSSGLTSPTNFQAELTFIASTLISNWTVSITQIEADPVVYDSQFLTSFGAFTYGSENELQQAINAAADYYSPTDAPGITYGLQKASDPDGEVNGQRQGVLGVTILFTSTSDPNDVNSAMQYAAKLKANGNTLIVVGLGPNANLTTLTPLASGPNFAFGAADYTSLATNIGLANQINTALCMPAGSTVATTTPMAQQSTTPAATTPSSSSMASTPAVTTSSSSSMTSISATTTPSSSSMTSTSAATTPSSSSMSSTPAATTPSSSSMTSTSAATTPTVTTLPTTPASSPSTPTSSSIITTSPSLSPAASTPTMPTSLPTTPAATSSNSPPTGSPCVPPTPPPNVFPCQANILILFDGSGGLNDTQFAQQNAFISNQLFMANWTFTQVAIGEFDNSGSFLPLSPFNTLNSLAEAQAIFQNAFRLGDNASITSALQQASTLNQFTEAQPCVKQRTILFTSTSDAADVASATPFATQLKTQGGNLIIIGMGNTVNINALTTLASPSSYFSWPDYGNVPPTLANSIVQAFHC